jgi:hypothetical protein
MGRGLGLWRSELDCVGVFSRIHQLLRMDDAELHQQYNSERLSGEA